MRLFLSSENVGNHAGRLLSLVGGNKKLAYIPNARDYGKKADSDAKTESHKEQFEALGFEFIKIDLRDYFGKSAALAKKIDGAGLVWVPGGNTFLLRRAMYDSGLDKLLVKLLREDKLVYGGSSAGSIVMTPSLHGTEWSDDPDQVKAVYGKDKIWNGLGLVDFYIVPHYGSDWFADKARHMAIYLKKHQLPYKPIRDGQVIVVDGEKVELLK
ncbi:MAG TPA: Type 1 glutamine amidotransferase-like domain-containing protein [Candidatus Saccharimonadales bacterium]|nr:Type 1 glutamine amidotransferase-like domain-containing protein [Candidatus Saccharimonadales bacterium]